MVSSWGWIFTGLVLIVTLSPSRVICFPEIGYPHCESVVSKWAEVSYQSEVHEDKLVLKDLLFFLHVPRTGGRSYFHCFLRNLYKKDQECPRSYDKLHFDPSKSKCRVLGTHDDYSLMAKLPNEKTSVMTILRSPLDRVLSTYEFSMEVAARFLVHHNLTSALQMSSRLLSKSRGVSTLDIWPWKYLVPWMREDLFARRDARQHNPTYIDGSRNPYDMEEIVMPLEEFINEPIVHDIVHNGATFQVTGLTNNSGLLESREIRHCVSMHPVLGHYVLKVAKRRLDNMLYVGLTEEHKKSATLFANMVGKQVLSQLEASTSEEKKSPTESGTSDSNVEDADSNQHQIKEEGAYNVSSAEEVVSANVTVPMTVHKLMDQYGKCTSKLRVTQARRRTVSLEMVAPANFSKEARKMVSDGIIQQILLLNSLDVELYEHAKRIFLHQQEHVNQSLPSTKREMKHFLGDLILPDWRRDLGYCGIWTRSSILILAGFLAAFFVLWYAAVVTRRRTSKLKV